MDLGSGAAALGREFLTTRLLAATAFALLWPAPAYAQDLGGVVVVLLPAVVLAPLAALAIKWLGLRMFAGRSASLKLLFGVTLLEFLLWEVGYPAGALFDLKIVPIWRGAYLLVGAVLVVLLLSWANFRLLGGTGMSERAARPIAFLFALLTPLCLLLLAAAFSGLAAMGYSLSLH